MGTPFSGTSDVVGALVTVVPGRATGQRRVVTHLNIGLNGATSILINNLDAAFYQDVAGIEIPPLMFDDPSTDLDVTASSGVVSTCQMSGYDEAVGESGNRFMVTATQNTANGTEVDTSIRAAGSTTEVLSVERVLCLPEATTGMTMLVGYDDDGAGTNFVGITPELTGLQSYDLGALKIPAGKYLTMRVDETAGAGAKVGSVILSYRILTQ